jgi:bifunctional non-homologous end joining protein LigD
MPLKSQEVNNRLNPSKFTMRTVGKRIDRLGDLWKPVPGAGVDHVACSERLVNK